MTEKPLNILYLSSFGDDTRGGQQSLLNLVSNLDRKLFRACVVIPTEKGGLAERLKNLGVDVWVVKLPKLLDLHLLWKVRALAQLFKIVNKNKINIIHTDGPRNTIYAGIVAKVINVPLIWHVRASNRDKYDRLLKIVSSKIILVADALQSRFDKNVLDKKFVTIHNGVDMSIFRPQESDILVRQKYQINNSELLITVIARLEKLKGQKYLIEACGKLKNEIEQFRLLLVGEVTDISYLRECEDIADESGIKEHVVFIGPSKKISQILNATDIFVLPSLFEPFPRCIIEAMAPGKPVIATNVGGCSEAIEDEISGFIVPSNNSHALADKILLLAKNKDLRKKMGSAARCRVEKEFAIEDKVKQVEKLYYEVL